MKHIALILCLLVIVIGCSPGPEPSPTPSVSPESPVPSPSPTPAVTTTPEPTGTPAHGGLPLPTVKGAFFSASGACAPCHTRLTDQAGSDVSIDTDWRATMMANAARDPYWRASVRSETLENPELQSVIEDKCATCHTGMARFTAVVQGADTLVLDEGFLNEGNNLHTLAVDGVSCTLCHQIDETGLGEAGSFSGGFVIDDEQTQGERVIYGPYSVRPGQVATMQAVTGFSPVQAAHIREARLCATCHTLYTPYVDASGEVAGEFPEQMAFLEWSNSAYSEQKPCQGCHMPSFDGVVSPGSGRESRNSFSRHLFVGGNSYILDILRWFGPDVNATASSTQFAVKMDHVLDQFQSRTATVSVESSLSGGTLQADVTVNSDTGHKFPTGFPSRRAWLHFRVSDSDGTVLFESGAVDSGGSIAGNDNDAGPGMYEPHYSLIDSADKVQIYESIMGDTEGRVTTTLLHGAGYLKDNRLLPLGFDKDDVEDDIAVVGAAIDDSDFKGGGDTVRYMVEVGEGRGPLTVSVDLMYQPIGYRWANNLRAYEADEVVFFLGYYDDVPNSGVAVASAVAIVSE